MSREGNEGRNKSCIMLFYRLPRVRETTRMSDRMTRAHKKLADSFIGVSSYLSLLPLTKNDPIAV